MSNSRIPMILIASAAVAVAGILVFQYNRSPGPGPVNKEDDGKDNLVYLENGLSMEDRAKFYHLAEGSEVYPILWMQALKTKEGKPFLGEVERLGFLKDPNDPDGLPVGLTSGITRGLEPLGPMTGLNCAACHVSELHYDGKRVRIDGAPNLLNTRQFFVTLIDSALDTAKNPSKLIAFVVRVHELEEKKKQIEPSKFKVLCRKMLLGVANDNEVLFEAALRPFRDGIDGIVKTEFDSDPLDLKVLLKEKITDVKAFNQRIAQGLKFDKLAELAKKSRVLREANDEGAQHDTVITFLHDLYISLRLLRARVVFLNKLGMVGKDDRTEWGAGRVDAFGSARAFLFDEKYKPINAVSYPPLFDLKTHNWFHYDNNTTTFLERNFGQALGVGALYDDDSGSFTLQPANLRELEKLTAKISAPKWPVDIFGKIDQDRAQRGSKLYGKYCEACHDTAKNESFANLYDLDDINTDPARALMFAETLPDGRFFPDAIKATMSKIKNLALVEFTPEEQAKIEEEPTEWRGPKKYAARTIKGCWATAPYLHNGSVQTLDDLLKPSKDRLGTFYVGSHDFDVETLGYKSDPTTTLFDTSKLGNSNVGHEGEKYGTSISPEERKDLLEYLKTQ